MPKTIKGKILTGLLITSVISMVITNIVIWTVFEKNLFSYIKNDMDKTKTIVLSEITMRYPFDNSIDFINKNEVWSIFNNINSGYNTYASLHKSEDNIRIYAGEVMDEKIIDAAIEEDNKLSSLLYIHKDGEKFHATFTHPLYLSNNYNGTLIFQKSYVSEYNNYNQLLKNIVLIQIILYTIMICSMYILLNKTTKPIKILTSAMVAFEKGDSFNQLTIHTKDEVATLMDRFNKMQIKILDQMEYLKLEKIRVEELEKSSRDFFNYATHELKTPITSINGYTQLLQGGGLERNVVERAYERIWIESNRMHTMIQNILIVARGKEVARKEPEHLDLEQLTKEVIEEYRLIYNNNEMDVSIISDQVLIFGVKEEIRTIILNLVNNAVKYSANKKITITCTSMDSVCFIIENKCLPIPKDIKSKLFEPFIKYNYEDYTKVSSGLGLFICKELADRNSMNLSYSLLEDKIRFELSV